MVYIVQRSEWRTSTWGFAAVRMSHALAWRGRERRPPLVHVPSRLITHLYRHQRLPACPRTPRLGCVWLMLCSGPRSRPLATSPPPGPPRVVAVILHTATHSAASLHRAADAQRGIRTHLSVHYVSSFYDRAKDLANHPRSLRLRKSTVPLNEMLVAGGASGLLGIGLVALFCTFGVHV